MKQKKLGAAVFFMTASVNSFASSCGGDKEGDKIDFSKLDNLGTLGGIDISTEENFKSIAKFKKGDGNEVSNILDSVKKIKDADLVLFEDTVKSPVELNKYGEVKISKDGKKIETEFKDFKKDDEIKAGKYFIIRFKSGENNEKIKIQFKVVKEDSRFGDKDEIVKKD